MFIRKEARDTIIATAIKCLMEMPAHVISTRRDALHKLIRSTGDSAVEMKRPFQIVAVVVDPGFTRNVQKPPRTRMRRRGTAREGEERRETTSRGEGKGEGNQTTPSREEGITWRKHGGGLRNRGCQRIHVSRLSLSLSNY